MLPEGLQLGHYRLAYLLNNGGMGEVYLAEDLLLHRQVAIKVIHANLAYFSNAEAAQEAMHLFLREARAVAQLDHPHILPLYDSGETSIDGMPLMYMVMPLRQEGSLAEWLQDHPRQPFSPQEAAYILQQAAEALQHAHDHQIVHLDVKPANFLIRGRQGWHLDLQLADFGVAKLLTASGDENEIPRGTPAYVAPEQWEGHPGPATDQYALAVMIYELLTGDVPFWGTQEEVMHQHLYVRPQPPGEVNPYLPASVDAILLRALKKTPGERYPSVSAFARAFQRALHNNGAVYQTVVISPTEAQQGTYRTLLLPGRRRVSVDIPSGVVDGEVMKFKGLGENGYGGQLGSLILTVNVEPAEDIAALAQHGAIAKTTPAFKSKNPVGPGGPERRSSSSLTWWLLPLVFFLILGSGSLFYFTQVQAMNAAYEHATATVQTQQTALMFAQGATETTSANNDATAAAQGTVVARATATSRAATATTAAKTTATAIAVTTATARTTATAQAGAVQATAYATTASSGTLQFNDPLQDNGLGYRWDEMSVSGGGCAFVMNAAYHSSVSQTNTISPCFARATDYRSFFYQVNMKILKGDQGGLIFCADVASDTFYYFSVGGDGTYALEIYKNANVVGTLQKGKSMVIKQGLDQTNLLAVRVQGGRIDLYINMQQVASVTDSTLTHGQIGVVAEDIVHPTEVAFSNALVRTF
jgi:serine/threonine protein kinase